jgi:hypothetical protein
VLEQRLIGAVVLGAFTCVVGCGGGSASGSNLASYDPVGSNDTPPGTAPLPPAPSPTGEPGSPAPRVSVLTSEGVFLEYPVWLERWPDQQAVLLEELRTVVPEADPRIPSDVSGVPPGTTVIVLDPGAYYAPYSPTGLAAGEWRAPSSIYVAWRGTQQGRVVPALAHELRHLLTGDPLAGH